MAIARKMMMARSSAERRKIIKGRGFFDFIKNVGSTIWKGVKAAAPILLPAAGAALIAATGGAAAPAVLAAGAGGAASGLASKLGAGPEVQAVTGLATSAAAEAAARHLTRGTVSTGQKRF